MPEEEAKEAAAEVAKEAAAEVAKEVAAEVAKEVAKEEEEEKEEILLERIEEEIRILRDSVSEIQNELVEVKEGVRQCRENLENLIVIEEPPMNEIPAPEVQNPQVGSSWFRRIFLTER